MQQEVLSTGTAPAATMAQDATKGSVRSQRTHRVRTRTKYIFRGDDGVDYLIETSEGYAARKQIHSGRASSLRKLARIARVRDRGFVKRRATLQEIRVYGPAINVSED